MLYREVPKNGDKLSVLGYGCMPSPAGVNIPSCFECYNSKHAFRDKGAKMRTLFIENVKPENYRLACQTLVNGPISVKTKP